MTPELLLPAGNFEKMKAAIRFGADAVYLAGKRFGLRAAADNFDLPSLNQAIPYAHERGKKVYLTVNITPHTYEYDDLTAYFASLADCPPDALIIADPGVFTLAGEILPGVERHISTQAGAVSEHDCLFWYRQGATRVVLARELSLAEIRRIRQKIPPELELECFIHGSMCVSFSGRCLLSEHYIGRDGNRGFCAQPCRWEYHLYEIAEVKRPDMRLPIEETDRGTFIMSSKDLCTIEHIPELMESGIASFKIEGRMKSAYYAAVTANTYRMAMDAYRRDPSGYTYDPAWMRELCSVTHREYCSGYYFDDPMRNGQLVTKGGYLSEKAYLATVESYDSACGRATLIQKNKLSAGQECELLTPGSVGVPFTAEELWDEEGNPIESAPHPYQRFSLKMPFPVKSGDIVRSL
ncbi:MAG: U32 family peptidase [Eubacteriales bacterium]